MATKEEVYDAEISPLMVQIIATCKAAGIPVHASFQLDEDLACTTHVAPKRADVPEADLEGFDTWAARYEPKMRLAMDGAPAAPLMITTRDATGAIRSMEAVL